MSIPKKIKIRGSYSATRDKMKDKISTPGPFAYEDSLK